MRLNPGSFKPDKHTKNNDLVRSTKEVDIANLLRRLGIRYEYEKELILNGERFVPDFYLSDFDVFLEYYGLMNWKVYADRTAYKVKRYSENNVRCIHLFKSSLININRILRFELNKIRALKEGEGYSYRAELPVFIMALEKQLSFKRKRKVKWEPMLDKVLLMNKGIYENLEILAKVLHKESADLIKRIKFLEGRKRKEDLEKVRNEARAKLARLSVKRPKGE